MRATKSVVLLLLATAVLSVAGKIHILSREIDTSVEPSFAAVHARRAEKTSSSSLSQYFIEVKKPLTPVERAELEASLGATLVSYIPDNAYIVVGDESFALNAEKQPLVQWVGERNARDRLASHLLDMKAVSMRATRRSKTAVIWVTLLGKNVFPNRRPAEEVATSIRTLTGVVSATAASDDKIQVTVYSQVAGEIAYEVGGIVDVDYVEEKPQLAFKNYYANLISSGEWTSATANAQFTGNRSSFFTNMGLDGGGQLIGIADSGIDWDNCLFWEANTAPPFNPTSPNFSTRKIAAYWWNSNGLTCGRDAASQPCGDDHDDSVAHGTHVSGSAAGQAASPNTNQYVMANAYDGMAYRAKIAFTDISPGEGLYAPTDLYTNLFPQPYAAGARIHSDSWGCSSDTPGGCNFYGSNDFEVDKYMYQNPSFLVLVAAGNSGQLANYGTIESPAGAKNIISVGASQKTSTGGSQSIQYANPNMLCEESSTPPACCKTSPLSCTEEDCCNYNPVVDCCPYSTKFASSAYNQNNMADFSSRGPTNFQNGTFEGRFKPDLVVPGDSIVSAHGDASATASSLPECAVPQGYTGQYTTQALAVMSGTSMATPVAAGLSALVRQYFVNGMYPTGTATSANVKAPSAALVKAVMLSSASMLTGTVSMMGKPVALSSLSLTQQHYVQGFGRVNLQDVLKGPSSNFNLFVDDNINGVAQGESVSYSITNVDVSSVPLVLTLVWTDYPASPTATKALVNDLSLSVTIASSTNPSYAAGTQLYPNDLSAADTLNNVEKTILSGGSGILSVNVQVSGVTIGSTTPWQSQMFALVARGNFTAMQATSSTSHTGNNLGTNPNPSIPSSPASADVPSDWTQPIIATAPPQTPSPANGAESIYSSSSSSSLVLVLLASIVCAVFFV